MFFYSFFDNAKIQLFSELAKYFPKYFLDYFFRQEPNRRFLWRKKIPMELHTAEDPATQVDIVSWLFRRKDYPVIRRRKQFQWNLPQITGQDFMSFSGKKTKEKSHKKLRDFP